jgi:iron complex outermembrane receptor protein
MAARIFFFRVLLTLSALLSLSEAIQAQPKNLREVKVRGRRKEPVPSDIRIGQFSAGMQKTGIDSLWLQEYSLQSLAQLLAQQTTVFVRAAGINSMATLNFRGSSAAQSQVFWNGVPLNSASAGATDVSLLQTNQFQQVRLLYGGSASLMGSGNVGGALLLDNDWMPTDTIPYHVRLGLEGGSFGQIRGNVHQTLHFRKWMLALNVNARSAENDFRYTLPDGSRKEMGHARMRAGAAMLQSAYQWSDSTFIRVAVWNQRYFREIPAATFEPISAKLQRDYSLRTMFHSQKAKGSELLYLKLSAIQERLLYEDSLINLSTNNNLWQHYAEPGWRHRFGKFGSVLLFAPITYAQTIPSADSVSRKQLRTAIAAAYAQNLLKDRLQWSISARAEKVEAQRFFLPGFNVCWRAVPGLKFRGNVQRTFRVPTLNEWYFVPGGNPQLRPEQGWSADAGWQLDVPLSSAFSFHQDASFFGRRIHDWIIWFGGSIWTPHNIATVYSRGIETGNTLTFCYSKDLRFWIGLNTSFVQATTVASYQPNDGSIGKQIPYTPRYNGQLNFGCSWKQCRFNYNHTYTGYRFITVDESAYLPPYYTGNLFLSWNIQRRNRSVSFNAYVYNIWDETYQIVAARPMPGRNVGIGMSMSL